MFIHHFNYRPKITTVLLCYAGVMVFKEQNIEIIVREIVQDQPGYWSIFFTRPPNFVFDAGDWIDLELSGEPLSGGRTYSLSSSPTESGIRISFREGISQFKNALQSVKPGDKLTITQYGNDYDFQLNKNHSRQCRDQGC